MRRKGPLPTGSSAAAMAPIGPIFFSADAHRTGLPFEHLIRADIGRRTRRKIRKPPNLGFFRPRRRRIRVRRLKFSGWAPIGHRSRRTEFRVPRPNSSWPTGPKIFSAGRKMKFDRKFGYNSVHSTRKPSSGKKIRRRGRGAGRNRARFGRIALAINP